MSAQKTALVTGAAKRIGRAIALTLARAGYDIGVHYGQSADEAHALVAELTALGATNVRNAGANSVYANDPIGYEIQISGLASTALGSGG